MGSFNLTKRDCKLLLAGAAALPVICFIGGLYTATITKADNASPDQTDKLATLTDNDSIAVTEKQDQDIESAPVPKHFVVQAGLFAELGNAERFQESLNKKDIEARLMADEGFHRVIVGSFYSIDDAKSFSQVVEREHNLEVFITSVGEPSTSQFIASL